LSFVITRYSLQLIQLPQQSKAPETLTKKQRQNAAKRDTEKALKAEAETERQAALRAHKKELEKVKMAEQAKPKGKVLSGGMTASVDKNGRLVWE
jgi:DNA-binding protein H-NS